MLRSMPSPSGTNHERLFIRGRGPVAAYDAAEGLTDDVIARLKAFLKGKISDEDLAKIEELLMNNSEMANDARTRLRVASDMATKHAGNERVFLERFPEAARIKQAW